MKKQPKKSFWHSLPLIGTWLVGWAKPKGKKKR
jgi:hypothetical protein